MTLKFSFHSLLLAAAAIAVLVVAGCGGNDNDNTTSTAASAPATQTTPAETTPTQTTPAETTPPARSTTTRAPAAAGASAAVVARGRELFDSSGCVTCHSISGERGTGPPLDGLAGSQVTLTDGRRVTANDAYLTRSIDDPDAEIVEGYPRGVMAAVVAPGSVSAPDTAALVAYIQSLR